MEERPAEVVPPTPAMRLHHRKGLIEANSKKIGVVEIVPEGSDALSTTLSQVCVARY
jgi:hypothetical protein